MQFERGVGSTLPSLESTVEVIHLNSVHEPGLAPFLVPLSVTLKRQDFGSMSAMLMAFQDALASMNPDIVMSAGGDQRWLPWLVEQAMHDVPQLGRTTGVLARSTINAVIPTAKPVIDTGRFLKGRLHLDIKNSFIVNEGGLAGLFELAQHSRQSAQIISRLSPGSVISAIQMRVAMDDGLLVPWKKNRPGAPNRHWICFMPTIFLP